MRIILSNIEKFIKFEATAGIILLLAALSAIVFANTDSSYLYYAFLHIPMGLQFGNIEVTQSLEHFVNDGLMAVFFLVVSLEIKREMVSGHLSTRSQQTLPLLAALGGVIVPALIYTLFNIGHEVGGESTLHGWAIPTATDIAFALGILALFGKRVPTSLKVFLMALAIIDDLMAIAIIAVFYNSDLALVPLLSALAFILILGMLNVASVTKKTPYLFFGFMLWVCIFNSGIHATLAGVILGLFIPLDVEKQGEDGTIRTISPLRELEKELHYVVSYLIVPLFAFVNAGVSFAGFSIGGLLSDPISIGVVVGLFIGKQLGIFGVFYGLIKSGIAQMPKNASWGQIYGVSVITGIGFTMSIFISNLAFLDNQALINSARLGVLVGSFFSAIIGYVVLEFACSLNPASNYDDSDSDFEFEQGARETKKKDIQEKLKNIEKEIASMASVSKSEKKALLSKRKSAIKAEKKSLEVEQKNLEKEEKLALKAKKKADKRAQNLIIEVDGAKETQSPMPSALKKELKTEQKAERKALAKAKVVKKTEKKILAKMETKAEKIIAKNRREEAKAAVKIAKAEKLAKFAEMLKEKAKQNLMPKVEDEKPVKKSAKKSAKKPDLNEKLAAVKKLAANNKARNIEKRAAKEVAKAAKITVKAKKYGIKKAEKIRKKIANTVKSDAGKANIITGNEVIDNVLKEYSLDNFGDMSTYVSNKLSAFKNLFDAQKELSDEVSKVKAVAGKARKEVAKSKKTRKA